MNHTGFAGASNLREDGVIGGARPPAELIVAFIHAHREVHGVESICVRPPIFHAIYLWARGAVGRSSITFQRSGS